MDRILILLVIFLGTSCGKTSISITQGDPAISPELVQVATQLVITAQPQNAVATVDLPAITVEIRDASNLLVTSATNAVTVTLNANIPSSGGTFNGTKTVNAIGGIATFSDLDYGTTDDHYTFTFSSTGLTSVTSDPFNITNPSTKLYRSVQAGATGALASSGATNSLTIVGNTATFDSALATNIGSGDVIQFDSGGAPGGAIDSYAIIHTRTSATSFEVFTNTGGVPTATSGDLDWEVYRAYTSLFNAEAGDENDGLDNTIESFENWSGGKDLSVSGETYKFLLYSGGTDTSPVSFTGWTTSVSHFIMIYTPTSPYEVGTPQNHNGTMSGGGYTLQATNADALTFAASMFVIRVGGIRIRVIGNGGDCGIRNNATLLLGSELIIEGDSTSTGGNNCGVSNERAAGALQFISSMFYGFDGAGSACFVSTINNTNGFQYSTFYNCDDAIRSEDGLGFILLYASLVQNSGTNSVNNVGGGTVSGNDNIADVVSDMPATDLVVSGAVLFTDTTPGSEDLHLHNSDTVAKNKLVLPNYDLYDIDHTLSLGLTSYGADQDN